MTNKYSRKDIIKKIKQHKSKSPVIVNMTGKEHRYCIIIGDIIKDWIIELLEKKR